MALPALVMGWLETSSQLRATMVIGDNGVLLVTPCDCMEVSKGGREWGSVGYDTFRLTVIQEGR